MISTTTLLALDEAAVGTVAELLELLAAGDENELVIESLDDGTEHELLLKDDTDADVDVDVDVDELLLSGVEDEDEEESDDENDDGSEKEEDDDDVDEEENEKEDKEEDDVSDFWGVLFVTSSVTSKVTSEKQSTTTPMAVFVHTTSNTSSPKTPFSTSLLFMKREATSLASCTALGSRCSRLLIFKNPFPGVPEDPAGWMVAAVRQVARAGSGSAGR